MVANTDSPPCLQGFCVAFAYIQTSPKKSLPKVYGTAGVLMNVYYRLYLNGIGKWQTRGGVCLVLFGFPHLKLYFKTQQTATSSPNFILQFTTEFCN